MSTNLLVPFLKDSSNDTIKWLILELEKEEPSDNIRKITYSIVKYLEKYQMINPEDVPIIMLVKHYTVSSQGMPIIRDSAEKNNMETINKLMQNRFVGQKMIKKTINKYDEKNITMLMIVDDKVVGQMDGPYPKLKKMEHIFVD